MEVWLKNYRFFLIRKAFAHGHCPCICWEGACCVMTTRNAVKRQTKTKNRVYSMTGRKQSGFFCLHKSSPLATNPAVDNERLDRPIYDKCRLLM